MEECEQLRYKMLKQVKCEVLKENFTGRERHEKWTG